MWLLNTTTLKLEHFVNDSEKFGRYAILSHVWLVPIEDEVTFQDIQNGNGQHKPGYDKIVQTCRRALEDKLDYVWIDTCCIDKTSSAELSQAINSMYRYYFEAKVCYAYLADVGGEFGVELKDSKWFTRGWTLQELIAPGYIEFFSKDWKPIGIKHSLVKELADITRIDIKVLRDRTTLPSVSVAARMAWAAFRETSREEDRAYSLMGVFDVNMPMLYGEGSKAFTRLQEEIVRNSTDHSILAWTGWEAPHYHMLFSPSPYGFRFAHDIRSWDNAGIDESYLLSNKGLRISLPILSSNPNLPAIPSTSTHRETFTAILNCRYASSSTSQLSLLMRKQPHGMIVPAKNLTTLVCDVAAYKKSDGSLTSLQNLDRKHLPSAKWQDLMILREPFHETPSNSAPDFWSQKILIHNHVPALILERAHPQEAWNPNDQSMSQVITGSAEHDRGYLIFFERDGGKKKKLILGFGQGVASGRLEPRICLLRDTGTPDVAVIFSALERGAQQRAKVEFKKGLSELSAEVGRRMSEKGEVEWVIDLKMEHYSNLFKHIVQERHGHRTH